MPNLNNEVAIAKSWATAHVVLAAAIAFAAGLVIGLVLG
jgi:hypothetical protein